MSLICTNLIAKLRPLPFLAAAVMLLGIPAFFLLYALNLALFGLALLGIMILIQAPILFLWHGNWRRENNDS